MNKKEINNSRLIKKLLLAVVFMFGFGFALVPLYDVFCEITGLNGKPSLEQAVVSTDVDKNRRVDVGFITHIQGLAPFEVSANTKKVSVQIILKNP